MIISPAFAGKRWGVLGLARTGRAVAAALAAAGGVVWAWDDGEAARVAFDGELVDLNTADLSGLAGIVVSPGVPHSAPIFAAAARAQVPVIVVAGAATLAGTWLFSGTAGVFAGMIAGAAAGVLLPQKRRAWPPRRSTPRPACG